MAKFFLTNKAILDLSDIWNYTFDNWSEEQADNYYQMLLDNVQVIVDKPNIGKSYEPVLKRLFGHKVGRHIIFYTIESEKEILIIRILHEQMDLKNWIQE
jgi:toxin ParE1/3/4